MPENFENNEKNTRYNFIQFENCLSIKNMFVYIKHTHNNQNRLIFVKIKKKWN